MKTHPRIGLRVALALAALALNLSVTQQAAATSFTTTGALTGNRAGHTATLLPNGKVLVAGGAPDAAGYSSFSSAEVYDPAAGTWTTIGPMGSARQAHTATLLPNGRVLVAAGYFVNNNVQLFSAELYDSAAGGISLVNPVKLPGGAFQLAFTSAENGTNTVLATTNPALPLPVGRCLVPRRNSRPACLYSATRRRPTVPSDSIACARRSSGTALGDQSAQLYLWVDKSARARK